MKNRDKELDREVEDFLRAEEEVSAFDPPGKQWAREIVCNQNRPSKVCGFPLAWVMPLAACFILVLFYNVDIIDGHRGLLVSPVDQLVGDLSQEDLVFVEDLLAEADFFHEINRLDLDDTMDLLVLLEPIP